MREDNMPWWAQNLVIRGFEDGEPDTTADDPPDPGGDADDDDDGGDQGKPDDLAAIKTALDKERKLRRAAEKAAKDATRSVKAREDQDKTEVERATAAAQQATERASRLAARLMETAVENVITKLAGKHSFADPDDVLRLLDRSTLAIDQDEDDPSIIEIDEAGVEAAIKALAKAKPHLIKSNGDGEPSGSKFGGGRKPSSDDADLYDRYPALARNKPRS